MHNHRELAKPIGIASSLFTLSKGKVTNAKEK